MQPCRCCREAYLSCIFAYSNASRILEQPRRICGADLKFQLPADDTESPINISILPFDKPKQGNDPFITIVWGRSAVSAWPLGVVICVGGWATRAVNESHQVYLPRDANGGRRAEGHGSWSTRRRSHPHCSSSACVCDVASSICDVRSITAQRSWGWLKGQTQLCQVGNVLCIRKTMMSTATLR